MDQQLMALVAATNSRRPETPRALDDGMDRDCTPIATVEPLAVAYHQEQNEATMERASWDAVKRQNGLNPI